MKGFVLLHLQISVPQESVTVYACHSLVTGQLLTAYAEGSLCGVSHEQAALRQVFLYTPKFSLAIYHSTNASYFCGTVGCSSVELSITTLQQLAQQAVFIKGLSLAALLQQIQWTAVPGDSVSLHCCSWYSRLQYHRTQFLCCYSRYIGLQCQGTQSHYIAAAGTVDCSITGLSFCTATADILDCSARGLSLTTLLQLVQQTAVSQDLVSALLQLVQYATVPRDSSHDTATAGTAGCSTKELGLIGLLQPVQYAAVPRDTVSAALLGLVTAYRMIAAVY